MWVFVCLCATNTRACTTTSRVSASVTVVLSEGERVINGEDEAANPDNANICCVECSSNLIRYKELLYSFHHTATRVVAVANLLFWILLDNERTSDAVKHFDEVATVPLVSTVAAAFDHP